MKKKYEAPEIELIRFQGTDIVTASGGLTDGDEGSGDEFDMGEVLP